MDLSKTRRRRSALALVCELLKVDDKVLNDFIKTGKVPVQKKVSSNK